MHKSLLIDSDILIDHLRKENKALSNEGYYGFKTVLKSLATSFICHFS